MDIAGFAEARRLMVLGQLRPSGVMDARILAAMGTLPRERFVPADLAARAYSDAAIPLPGGRMMPSPLTAARLAELAAVFAGTAQPASHYQTCHRFLKNFDLPLADIGFDQEQKWRVAERFADVVSLLLETHR